MKASQIIKLISIVSIMQSSSVYFANIVAEYPTAVPISSILFGFSLFVYPKFTD